MQGVMGANLGARESAVKAAGLSQRFCVMDLSTEHKHEAEVST